MTTGEQDAFFARRIDSQRRAERLGLRYYVANDQLTVLLGELDAEGRWPMSVPRDSRDASDTEIVFWQKICALMDGK